jgi:8-oxo-dGTP pyrophosphatase MutT (NUDIX family)
MVAELLAELRAHPASDEREAAMRARIVAFIEAEPAAFERTLARGHVTASAWIVDPARTQVLLLHHRKLDRWLQPGGHVDGNPDVRAAALREAREETGLRTLRFATENVYDLDVHPIPARGTEPAHEHFDIRFALEADPREPLRGNDESHDLRWVALDALEDYAIDDSVRRLAVKVPTLPR